jgi:hypothetical protein
LGGGQSGEVKFIATHRDADTVHFGLGWSDGRNEASIGALLAVGTARRLMKMMVLVLVGIWVPTPWARRPRWLARAVIQIDLSQPVLSARFSRD